MKLLITAQELLDKGLWMSFCELRGLNEWVINEGQMETSNTFELTLDEAESLGLITRRPDGAHQM